MTIEIISPEKTLTIEDVKAIFLNCMGAKMEVLPGHAPAIVYLDKGNLSFLKESLSNIMLFCQGYAHVTGSKTTILLEDF